MKRLARSFFITCFLSCFLCTIGKTQVPQLAVGLFDSEEVLNIQLSGKIRELVKDRSDDMQYHDITLSYKASDSSLVTIPIQVKTRGHFRRTQGNCSYPPLMLNFSKDYTPQNSIFHNQHKIKLVTPCKNEKYVLQEYLVYKLSNLVSPKSFRARLVKVTYNDTDKGKISEPLYGILLEDEHQMAKRNNSILIEGKMVRPERTISEDYLKMAVFEYMIGNTDWSVQYYQNVKLIAIDSSTMPSTVPYDFDHAGIVDAPYAKPAEALQLGSIRVRRYRGYCMNNLSSLDGIFSHFNQLKEDIYNVYTKNTLLDQGYVKATVKFLDEFYKTINNPKLANTDFDYPCRKDGTGNVVIQGLDKK
ncbi:MAG: hypothetical protein JJE09_11670 [Bacteroidia bacterium]|nr:hypothetical protein [Bacteroidia bacterium]